MTRIVLLCGVLTLSACQTMSMPSLDLIKSPEFSEDAANIEQSYPRAVDAPVRPEDIRSARQWDRDAKALQRLRNRSQRAKLEAPLSDEETDRMFEELKDKAQAYKEDDPAAGTDAEYPPRNLQRRRN